MKIALLAFAVLSCTPSIIQMSYASEINNKQTLDVLRSKTSDLNTLYQADFSKLNQLPQQWRIPGNNPGSISIQNGYLVLDGRASASQPTSVLLPTSLENQHNFRIDADVILEQPINSSRWGSVIYDVVTTQGVIPSTYYQFTLRNDMSAKNGTEFGNRKSNGQWNVIEQKAFTQSVAVGQTVQMSIVVQGNRVQHYLNHQLMQDIELDQQQLRAGLGLSATGLIMKIRKIKVSEQNAVLPALKTSIARIQIPEIQVSAPPTLIQKAIKLEQDFINTTQANQIWYELDGQLKVRDTSGHLISDLKLLLEKKPQHKILVLHISDRDTLTALKRIQSKYDLSDIILVSQDLTVLKAAYQLLPAVRTALDLSQQSAYQKKPKDIAQLIAMTHQARSRIMILPSTWLDKPTVSFIQQRLMTVWARQEPKDSIQAATLLTTGVNGILSSDTSIYSDMLKQFPKNTLLRQPFIIGHRGVPSLEDENTLESTAQAAKLGANIIENDIYLTKDNHLVVMHDNTVNRTTTGTGKIEDMTLAEVQQLKTTNKNYHVPTLAEYLIWLKKNKQIVLMIEIKSSKPTLMTALSSEIEKYDVADQVVITSFNRDQLQQAEAQLSVIPAGLLVGSLPHGANQNSSTKQVLVDAQKYVTSYHPPYRSDLMNIFNEAQQRGVSFWPWNLNDATFKQLYVAGLNGVTTNNIQKYSNWLVDVQAKNLLKVRVGQTVIMPLDLKAQNGTMSKMVATDYIVLKHSPAYTLKNNQLTFMEKGTAYILAGYKYLIDSKFYYYLYSKPIKVQIQ